MAQQSEAQRDVSARRRALRQAWPHRHGLRGRIVVQVNVRRLRELRDA